MRIPRNTESLPHRTAMIGIAGTATAITSSAMPVRGTTQIATTPGRKISMPTVSGDTSTITATSGIPMSRVTGLRIAAVIGSMNPITVGLGWATSLGDGLHITTGGGCMRAARGDGGRDRCTACIVRSGRRRTFPSEEGAADLVSALDLADGVALAGFRWDRATGSTRGGADIAAGLAL